MLRGGSGAEYRGWYYGTAAEDCTDDKLAILTPHGLRQIKQLPNLNIVSFYIDVPRRDRLIKILERGDDIEEAKRHGIKTYQFSELDDINKLYLDMKLHLMELHKQKQEHQQ